MFSYVPVTVNPSTGQEVPTLPTLPASGSPNAMPWVTCNGSTSSPVCTVNLIQLAQTAGFTNPNNTPINQVVGSVLSEVESSATAAGVTISPTPPSLFQEQINFNSKASANSYLPDIRLDYNASKKHSFEFDYHYSYSTASPDLLNNVDATFPVAPFNTETGAQLSNRNLLVGAWRWTINSSSSNELRVGINSAPVNFGGGINSNTFPTIGTNLGAQKYTFGITGVSPIFQSLLDISDRNSAFGQLADNFVWTKGSHSFSYSEPTRLLYYNDFRGNNASVGFGIDNQNDPMAIENISAINGVPVFSGGPGSCVDSSCPFNGAIPNIDATQFANAEGIYASLTGRVDSFNSSVFYSPTTGGFLTGAPLVDKWRQNEIGFYAEDSWRVRPNLTFNYGLRWEYSGVPYDTLNEYSQLEGNEVGGADGVYGISGNGNLFKPGVLAGPANQFLVNDKGKSWYNSYYRGFAPTVGLAWQPHSDRWGMKQLLGSAGKSVLRAGYNIAYDREGLANFSSLAAGNPGYFGSQFSSTSSANDPVNGFFTAGSVILANNTSLADVVQSPSQFVNQFELQPQSGSVNAFAPNLRPPMIQSWSAGLQRELSTNNVVEIRYQANHASGLWDQFNINEVKYFEKWIPDWSSTTPQAICRFAALTQQARVAAEKDMGILAQTSTATTPVQDFADLFAGATAACAGSTPPASCAQSLAALSSQRQLPTA